MVGRRCGHIAVPFAVNVATVKDSRRPTENEINCSFDVTVLIILTTLLAVSIEGILKT